MSDESATTERVAVIEASAAVGLRPERLRSKSCSLAGAACVAAGVAGIVIWSFAAYHSGLEHAVGGLAIGALIGGACILVGGRGNRAATGAAGIALTMIVVGKLVAADRAIAAEFDATEAAPEFATWAAADTEHRTVLSRVVAGLDMFDFVCAALGIAIAFACVMHASRVHVRRRALRP